MKLLIAHARAQEYRNLIEASLGGEIPDLKIEAAGRGEEFPSSAADADVILAWRIPKALLRSASSLKWLASTGAGVDHLLFPDLPESVTVTKAPPIFAAAVSEYVMGYILHVSLGVEEIVFNLRKRHWSVPRHFHLQGKLMGVLGMGTIGCQVARTARCFGMRVWGVTRTLRRAQDPARMEAERMFGKDDIASFLPDLDFFVLTLPLTDETRNMIGKKEVSLLKPTCWIVNVSRGRIVDEDDLAEALRRKAIGGYISDVFSEEPLQRSSPLWKCPNVILTPHYAALTQPADFVPHFVENLKRFARGEPLRFQIDRTKGY